MDGNSGLYVLRGKEAVECPDYVTWSEWLKGANRTVARDTVKGCIVSTVFLASDHSLGMGPPMLFETMVFGGYYDQEQYRCSTWDEADLYHKRMIGKILLHEWKVNNNK